MMDYKGEGQALDILKTYFGYDSFRMNQQQAIDNILNGKDTVVIMPTGGGKSICYQIPALMLPGMSIIISPLIALMKDQVDSLKGNGIEATYLNSTLSYQEIALRMREIGEGKYKIIYVAPERLETDDLQHIFHNNEISMVAVDEAHCVSQWGHDFRPSYNRIKSVIERLPKPPIVCALTATATTKVKEDIIHQLGLKNPGVFESGFDRPNLFYGAYRGINKEQFIVDYCTKRPSKGGIVYCATRKEVEHLQDLLSRKGIKAGMYHGGMQPEQRRINQEDFIYENIDVMVATNAFGMGIDKSNVRYVIHHNMPESMEAYYQEAGRAGRDGEPAECILLFSPADVQIRRFLLEQSTDQDSARISHKYEKLQQMVDYCYVSSCLRKHILAYFGEVIEKDDCGQCSNCTQEMIKEDITVDAQKVFSCVVRMKERFGIGVIAQVLKGSKVKKLERYSFNELTTYGIMSGRTLDSIKLLIQSLIAEGYMVLTTDAFPVVRITEKAVNVLKNGEKVFGYEPAERVREEDHGLFDALRQLRKSIAEEEKIPPYGVFSDATLKEFCKHYPIEDAQFMDIKGVGQKKLDKYGDRFMACIKTYVDEHAIDLESVAIEQSYNTTKKRKSKGKGKKGKDPSYKVSLELFNELGSIEKVSKERELKPLTVENHLFEAYEAGLDLDLDVFIPSEHEVTIRQAIEESYNASGNYWLRPIKELLAVDVSYSAIKAVLRKHNYNTDTK